MIQAKENNTFLLSPRMEMGSGSATNMKMYAVLEINLEVQCNSVAREKEISILVEKIKRRVRIYEHIFKMNINLALMGLLFTYKGAADLHWAAACVLLTFCNLNIFCCSKYN